MGASPRLTIRSEFRSGTRFRFGKNWQRFSRTVDERSIQEAERRLKEFLGTSSLDGKTFVDIGSGSGLHSLAARRLGARVVSFDYDPQSVDATREIRHRSGFDDDTWRVEVGSVLDSDYLSSLGQFDVVYSWGVLHHTGAMWQALENVKPLVKEGGKLYIAIYNDAGKQPIVAAAQEDLLQAAIAPEAPVLRLGLCAHRIAKDGHLEGCAQRQTGSIAEGLREISERVEGI